LKLSTCKTEPHSNENRTAQLNREHAENESTGMEKSKTEPHNNNSRNRE
jgi:hypothetical protein